MSAALKLQKSSQDNDCVLVAAEVQASKAATQELPCADHLCIAAEMQARAASIGMGSAAVLSRALGPQLAAQAQAIHASAQRRSPQVHCYAEMQARAASNKLGSRAEQSMGHQLAARCNVTLC